MKSEVVRHVVLVLFIVLSGCDSKKPVQQVQPIQKTQPTQQAQQRSLRPTIEFEALGACALEVPVDYPDWESKLQGKITALPNEESKAAEWHRANMVEAYRKHGHRSPKWDEDANALMERWVAVAVTPGYLTSKQSKELGEKAKVLVDRGCSDPIVAYMRAYYLGVDPKFSKLKRAAKWRRIANAVGASDYPPERKFWAYLHAASWMDSTMAETIMEYYELTLNAVGKIARDPAVPDLELAEIATHWYLQQRQNARSDFEAWRQIDKKLNVDAKPSFAQNLLKGRAYVNYAWAARGGQWNFRVGAQGSDKFFERLSVAEEALVTAWYQRPDDWRAPTYLLDVELGLGRHEFMERRFERAMTAYSANYEAVQRKFLFLEPRWHGTLPEIVDFGRECFESTKWTGTVPLSLVEAHRRVMAYQDKQEQYFLRAEVWKDIHASYDQYLKREPDDHLSRSHFVQWAALCEQPAAAREALDELGTNVVKSAWKNEREFEKDVAWVMMKTEKDL